MNTGKTSFLTNEELIAQLSLCASLTDLEQQLLDRLILAQEECERLEQELTRHRPFVTSDGPSA